MKEQNQSKKEIKIPKEAKEISKGLEKVGRKTIKTSQDVGSFVSGVEKEGIGKTSEKLGKDIYQTGKAGVETGVAMGKGVTSIVTYPIKKRRSIWDFFWKRRKGIITGAADNDPAGIVTYTQTGAIAGYNLLWLVPLAWPMLVVTEEMSARVGMVTKKGLNKNIVEHFGIGWAWLATIIVFVCNTFTIGANIAAMSDVAAILTHLHSFIFVILFGSLFAYILLKQGYARVSRYLFLITPIFLLYIISALMLDVPWGQALRDTFIPVFEAGNANFFMIAVAFLGTTISPFLIFWQASQEIESHSDKKDIKYEGKAVMLGMFFTQLIAFFIVITGAAAFAGRNELLTNAKDVAMALEPFGKASIVLFSAGILGSGFIAIPVLAATTGYTFTEVTGQEAGLNKGFKRAKPFYLVILISIIIGVIISLTRFNPILILVYSQVLNGILTPILIIFLLLICNNKKIMGKYSNGWLVNIIGIFTVLIMTAFSVVMFWNL